ncbi:DUF805 domain-containing protein [Vibrio ostreae]|uniref:DUF805 domain-containing protein n=1 Tax=Vibrio ostreae TaxID=2841925 RepID=A0A975U5J9_9VIBR|nr:DUF805 domain-containing protein [Vibrio ostreae]QXO15563.1 DUF805 domain-containing protein [Vibrio ostreae]
MKWYWLAWQHGLDFSGRVPRHAYWAFFAVNLVVSLLLIALDIHQASIWSAWLEIGYSVASFLPLLALTVRRLHDLGHSGWWSLVFLVPAIGVLILLVLMLLPGEKQANQYGLAGEEKI